MSTANEEAGAAPRPWPFWLAVAGIIIAANLAKHYNLPAALVSVPLVGADILTPLVDFIVNATQGLVAILLLSVYFNLYDRPSIERQLLTLRQLLPKEFSARFTHQHEELVNDLHQLAEDSIRARAQTMTAYEAVAQRYPTGPRTDALVDMILPDHVAPYIETDIAIELEDVREDLSFYRFTATYRHGVVASAQSTKYVVAVVDKVDLAIQLEVQSSVFTEVFHTSNLAQPPSVGGSLGLESLQLEWRSVESSGAYSASFARVNESDQVKAYLGENLKDRADDVHIYVATLGPHARYVNFRSTILADKSLSYCTWQTYRPVYLQYLEVDARGLTWHGKRPTFYWAPFFLANLGTVQGTVSEGAFRAPVFSWLARGHGAIVLWSDG